jgi:hypothetical protein
MAAAMSFASPDWLFGWHMLPHNHAELTLLEAGTDPK